MRLEQERTEVTESLLPSFPPVPFCLLVLGTMWPMKLPRWLVIGMLTSSLLSVLAAAGWWWVTWPERTAREFVALLAERRFNEALTYVNGSPGEGAEFCIYQFSDEAWDVSKIALQHRPVLDVICGRQTVDILPELNVSIDVERGKITADAIVGVRDLELDKSRGEP